MHKVTLLAEIPSNKGKKILTC